MSQSGWMLVVSLVIALSFLSSAQRSPQCTAAIIALFHNDSANVCENAYLASVEFGNATGLQKAMVCDADQQCNSMIEYIITLCGDKVESPTRFDQDLSCATDSNGTNCFFAYNDFVSNGGLDILEAVVRNCFSCNQACAENLLLMNETLGCCLAEIFQALANRGSVADASIFTDAYPNLCGLGTFALCNSDTLPSTPCTVATVDLVNTDDECSRALESLFTGTSSESITSLYSGDCPTRLLNYSSVCSNVHGEGFLQFAQIVFATSQARSSNGRRCSEFIEQRSSIEDGIELTCVEDFFLRKCSSACRQGLANPTAEFGCCFNTFVAEFNSRSIDIPSQIEYTILTREIYDLCEIDSGGFCNGTSPPSYTSAAEQCISVANSFSANDNCLEHYYALGVRSSAATVNNAAAAICANEMCTSHMSSYINYLLTCQVVSIDDDEYDDYYHGDNEENDKYLGLANLIGNTTCKADRNNTSCYFSILSSPMYPEISRAFDVGYLFAACAEVITDSTCLWWCKQFLTEATESLGCCFVEYARTVLSAEGIQNITTLCESDVLLGTRCSEIQDINIAGSATTTTQKALGGFVFLLLEMITVTLITCFY